MFPGFYFPVLGCSDHYNFNFRKDKDVIHTTASTNLLVKVSNDVTSNTLKKVISRRESYDDEANYRNLLPTISDVDEIERLLDQQEDDKYVLSDGDDGSDNNV
jgi:hypothetical protein